MHVYACISLYVHVQLLMQIMQYMYYVFVTSITWLVLTISLLLLQG